MMKLKHFVVHTDENYGTLWSPEKFSKQIPIYLLNVLHWWECFEWVEINIALGTV